MAQIVADRVMETSVTSGVGPLALGGAVIGYRAFSSVCTAPSDTVYYAIEAVNSQGNATGDWEVGLGTYSAANTLTRTTPSASSNGGSAVNFGSDTKRVWIDATAGQISGLATSANPTFTGTVTVTNATLNQIEKTIAQWAIPMIIPSSHTMGNNGAISAMTALPATYSGGAWIWMATDQVAVGVAAGWYWFVASSTTAGTVYNSAYTTGVPGMGVTTAFSTTGPGANAGATTEIFGPQIAVPAGALGLNGCLRIEHRLRFNNTANVKNVRTRYSGTGGSQFSNANFTGRLEGEVIGRIWNRGVANSQYGVTHSFGSAVVIAITSLDGAIDTASATTLVISGEHTTATDNIVIETGCIAVSFFLT